MTMSNITGMVGGALTLIGWYSFKPMLIILGGIISLGKIK